MRKHILLLSLLSLSIGMWSCSNDAADSKEETTSSVSSRRTADMADFEKSFSVNAKKLEKGEITQQKLEELTLATAKKYLSTNNQVIKENATDSEIINQALDYNLERHKLLNSKN